MYIRYIMVNISYINFWPEDLNNIWFTKFIKYHFESCKIVPYDKSPDILFASCFNSTMHLNKVKSVQAKCKIFFYGENLERYPPYNDIDLLRNTFDYIVGFKETNIQEKQIRFPLWLIYYPYYSWNSEHNILTHIQNKYNVHSKQKRLFATIISRHDRGGQRTLIYDELSKYGTIESPGNYRRNTKPIGEGKEDKIRYISQSLYNICPENSCFEGYHTEKIFQAFEGGTIPLYWGIDLPEPNIINRNKYCFCDIKNIDSLQQSIKHACDTPDYYLQGELFHENAGKHIENYYNTFIMCIKSVILHS